MDLARVGLVFDGDDLVVYGAVVMTFLRDASPIGPVHPATAGALGGCALGNCAGAAICFTLGCCFCSLVTAWAC